MFFYLQHMMTFCWLCIVTWNFCCVLFSANILIEMTNYNSGKVGVNQGTSSNCEKLREYHMPVYFQC